MCHFGFLHDSTSIWRMKLRALSMSMSRWCEYIQCRRKLRRFLARMKHSALYNWFSQWQDVCAQTKHKKVLLSRFLRRGQNLVLHRSFSEWENFADRRIMLRQRMVVTLRRYAICSPTRYYVFHRCSTLTHNDRSMGMNEMVDAYARSIFWQRA